MNRQDAPDLAVADAAVLPAPLLDVSGLVRDYPLPRERLWAPPPRFRALDGVDFTLAPGRSLGVVGESGSGKSTLARLVMALDAPTAGQVRLRGRDLHALDAAELRAARRDVQMVFQDPYGSLDPRMTVERIVAEPLAALEGVPRPQQRERVAEVLAQVGLRPSDAGKYPHEFSGGQRQRIAIARAIVTRPALVVADEPVSALDVSVQAQVLNLLQDLQEQAGLSLLLISTTWPWYAICARRSWCSGKAASWSAGAPKCCSGPLCIPTPANWWQPFPGCFPSMAGRHSIHRFSRYGHFILL